MNERAKISEWTALTIFQVNIAKRWQRRAAKSTDEFAKFFFYFAGFNALYFLWGKIDDVRNKENKPAGEGILIRHLLAKLDETTTTTLVNQLNTTVCYFTNRNPVQRMDCRDKEHQIDGDEREGKRWREELKSDSSAQAGLQALGSVLYIIRSNLVHGSKGEVGDDEEIVRNSVKALKYILEATLAFTEREIEQDKISEEEQ